MTPPDIGGPSDVSSWDAESMAVSRKKTLLRILALREAARMGLTVNDAEVQAFAVKFRRGFRLADESDLERWLAASGLSQRRFGDLLHDFTMILKLEALLEPEIERRLADQHAIWTAHRWALKGGKP